ncbi:MAG TPA: diacylglycerol kinase family protein [Labilithrix sp.]|jgi:diacylglycerol kinase family enzyme|nr:diacylglycerol kinase family protein [Labilithrix sp.]
MRVVFVINTGAGRLAGRRSSACATEVLARCRSRRIDAMVELSEPARLTSSARRLARQDVQAVVAVGGDGTVSAVAAGLVGTGVALGVVPLGTLNHFSKDLGIADLDTTLDAIATERTTSVDVGEVNGHIFINNSSIGVYPEFIVERDSQRRHTGVRRWGAAMIGAARRLSSRYELEVTIAVPGHVLSTRTPFVFIGNNAYTRGVTRGVRQLGTRDRLDQGKLSVYTLHATTPVRMLQTLLKALIIGKKPPEFEEHLVDRVAITTPKRTVKVAIDGEVVRMRPPLIYHIRPAALRVLAPRNEVHGTETPLDEAHRPHLGSTFRRASRDDRPRVAR